MLFRSWCAWSIKARINTKSGTISNKYNKYTKRYQDSMRSCSGASRDSTPPNHGKSLGRCAGSYPMLNVKNDAATILELCRSDSFFTKSAKVSGNKKRTSPEQSTPSIKNSRKTATRNAAIAQQSRIAHQSCMEVSLNLQSR